MYAIRSYYGLKLDQFIGSEGETLTLRELRGKYAKAFAKAGMGPAPVPKVKPPAAIKPTAKPVVSTLSLLDGTEVGDWNQAAFAGAPENLQRRVTRTHKVKSVRHNQKSGAYYDNKENLINISGYDMNTHHGQSVWRHEFGHSIDADMGTDSPFDPRRSQQPDFT